MEIVIKKFHRLINLSTQILQQLLRNNWYNSTHFTYVNICTNRRVSVCFFPVLLSVKQDGNGKMGYSSQCQNTDYSSPSLCHHQHGRQNRGRYFVRTRRHPTPGSHVTSTACVVPTLQVHRTSAFRTTTKKLLQIQNLFSISKREEKR